MRIAHILQSDLQKRCLNTIITAISAVLTVIISRDGGDSDRSEKEQDGLICVLHLGQDYPNRDNFNEEGDGEIEYKLMSKGRILDRHKISGGFKQISNHIHWVLLPLMNTLKRCDCLTQVKDHIGYKQNTSFLRKLISSIVDFNNRNPFRGPGTLTSDELKSICEQFKEIFACKNENFTTLYYGYVWGVLKLSTFQYSYAFPNLSKYCNSLKFLVKSRRNSVYSLETKCKIAVIKSINFNPNKMMQLYGILPQQVVTEMMDSLIVKYATPFNTEYTLFRHQGHRTPEVQSAMDLYNLNPKTITTADVVALKDLGLSDYLMTGLFIEVVLRKFSPYVSQVDDDLMW